MFDFFGADARHLEKRHFIGSVQCLVNSNPRLDFARGTWTSPIPDGFSFGERRMLLIEGQAIEHRSVGHVPHLDRVGRCFSSILAVDALWGLLGGGAMTPIRTTP